MSNIIHFNFHSHRFNFHETATAPSLINEIFADNYHVIQSGMKFGHSDVIIDLGANEGMFSIMMAKLFPSTTIYSFEPVARTYKQLLANISVNKIDNIKTFQCGVGSAPGTVEITVDKKQSGGSSSVMTTFNPAHHYKETIKITTVDSIFATNKISSCKLLKIDIEGMEHEALKAVTVWSKISNLVGEFHINNLLMKQGRSTADLVNLVASKTNLLHYEYCKMSE